ncbi:hypothetical protein COCNU_07G012900 [Cocos nucifera]|uniref:Uncharacterized protein n=1 Tax=Cocos nucifera TaxID=13894 RepID=A0A8K0IG62_COCNU|nr:hypothetical protein COCNU_07G012900 [Cocos nucifera]
MAFTIISTAEDRPSYWAMEKHEQNSKCKSTRRELGEEGMAGMGDIGGSKKEARQEARDEKEGAMMAPRVMILAEAPRGAIEIDIYQERRRAVVG